MATNEIVKLVLPVTLILDFVTCVLTPGVLEV